MSTSHYIEEGLLLVKLWAMECAEVAQNNESCLPLSRVLKDYSTFFIFNKMSSHQFRLKLKTKVGDIVNIKNLS